MSLLSKLGLCLGAFGLLLAGMNAEGYCDPAFTPTDFGSDVGNLRLVISDVPMITRDACVEADYSGDGGVRFPEGWSYDDGNLYVCLYSSDPNYDFGGAVYYISLWDPYRTKRAKGTDGHPVYGKGADGYGFMVDSRPLRYLFKRHRVNFDDCYENDLFFAEAALRKSVPDADDVVARSNRFIIERPPVKMYDFVIRTSRPGNAADCMPGMEDITPDEDNNNRLVISPSGEDNTIMTGQNFYICVVYEWLLVGGTAEIKGSILSGFESNNIPEHSDSSRNGRPNAENVENGAKSGGNFERDYHYVEVPSSMVTSSCTLNMEAKLTNEMLGAEYERSASMSYQVDVQQGIL